MEVWDKIQAKNEGELLETKCNEVTGTFYICMQWICHYLMYLKNWDWMS